MVHEKKKVLLVTVRADFGGGPEHVFQLISVLHDKVELFVACPKDFPYWERYKEVLGSDKLFELPHRKFSLWSFIKLFRLIGKHNIALVHSHGKGAGIYGRLLAVLTHIHSVHTFHGIHIDQYGSWQRYSYALLERVLATMSDKLVSVSSGEAEIVRRLINADHTKLVVINNGVVIPEQCVLNQGYSEGLSRLEVVMITRPDNAKNPELLIDISRNLCKNNQLNRFRFLIIGAGFEQSDFRNKVDEAGLTDDIIICGASLDVSQYLRRAFCYLSTSRHEGLPLSVLEALAWCVPVIASNVVGNNDIIEHGINGLLYDLERPEQASNFLIMLADNEKFRREIARNGRESVKEKHSAYTMAKETGTIYENILAANNAESRGKRL